MFGVVIGAGSETITSDAVSCEFPPPHEISVERTIIPNRLRLMDLVSIVFRPFITLLFLVRLPY